MISDLEPAVGPAHTRDSEILRALVACDAAHYPTFDARYIM